MYFAEDFSSLASFVDAMNKRPRCEGAGNSSVEGSLDFTKTRNYNEADYFAKYGDKDSAKMIQHAVNRLRANNVGTEQRAQARVRRSVVGSRPCVPAAIIGHPLTMYRRTSVKTQRPVVNVYYNTSVSWTVDAEKIAEFGAKIVEALQSVERSGIRINMFVGAFLKDGDERVACFVRVKDSSKDLDVIRMSYPIVNPSLLRRHIFRYIETRPELTQSRWRNGYGRVIEGKNEQEFWSGMKKENAVLLSFTKDGKKSSKELSEYISKLGK